MKRIFVLEIILIMLFLTGCNNNTGTSFSFESYNQLENPLGKRQSNNEFTFEVDNKRYEVMNRYTAKYLKIAGWDKDNKYKLIIADSDRKEIFSMDTEKKYKIEAVRECTDTDGKVYIFYSKWDNHTKNLYLDDLISTHILEMDMKELKVNKQYDFGPEVLVLTVHDGYLYSVEYGTIYRSKIEDLTKKEYVADLGYRGIPRKLLYKELKFDITDEGIDVRAIIPNINSSTKYSEGLIENIKYADLPAEVIKK